MIKEKMNYLKNLKIVKKNLVKFYYNGASEWLRKDILTCISAINNEITMYEDLVNKYRNPKINQTTMYDFM